MWGYNRRSQVKTDVSYQISEIRLGKSREDLFFAELRYSENFTGGSIICEGIRDVFDDWNTPVLKICRPLRGSTKFSEQGDIPIAKRVTNPSQIWNSEKSQKSHSAKKNLTRLPSRTPKSRIRKTRFP